jgi:hypothetical protein
VLRLESRLHPQAEAKDRSSLTSDVCRDCLGIRTVIQRSLAIAALPLRYRKETQSQQS